MRIVMIRLLFYVNKRKTALCFLLGNSPASEFYKPTFRNTLFHLYRQVSVELPGWKNVRILHPNPPLPCHPPPYWLRLFLSQTLSRMNTPTFLQPSHTAPTCLWRWNWQSVPKRRHIKMQMPGNCPEESIKHSEHGESLKSKRGKLILENVKYQATRTIKKMPHNDWRFNHTRRPRLAQTTWEVKA